MTARRTRARPKASSRRRRGRRRWSTGMRRLFSGDRPFILAFVIVVAVVATMAIGPVQNFTAATERVADLERSRGHLQAEVDALEERRDRLSDPEHIELLARRDLGLIRPGEVPFIVVTPEPDLATVHAPQEAAQERPWYERLLETIEEFFR